MASTHEICGSCAEVAALRQKIQELQEENRELRLQAQLRRPPPSPQTTPSTLQIKFETPQVRTPNPENDWKNGPVRLLLRETPETEEEWTARRQIVGLSEPQAIIRAFYLLASTRLFPLENGGERQVITTQDSLLRSSEKFAIAIERVSERWEQLARFAVLIHVSLCRVAAITRPHTVSEVDKRMNRLRATRGKTTVGADYLRRLRAAVLWPIHQAEKLREKAGNRAYELFFLCKSPT